MAELKPCPFCGGEAEIIVWKRSKTTPIGCMTTNHSIVKKLRSKYAVKCKNNKHPLTAAPITRFFFVKKQAIEAWNRRVDNG